MKICQARNNKKDNIFSKISKKFHTIEKSRKKTSNFLHFLNIYRSIGEISVSSMTSYNNTKHLSISVQGIILLCTVLFVSIFLTACGNQATTQDAQKQAKESNDRQFTKKGVPYFADVWVAIGLNAGYKGKKDSDVSVNLAGQVIPIQQALEEKSLKNRKIIASNINEIATYRDILKIDIKEKLDSAPDRQAALKAQLELLNKHYSLAQDNLKGLDLSRKEITATLSEITTRVNNARSKVDNSFAKLDPSDVDEYVGEYISAKEDERYAQTYLVLTDRLRERYAKLQSYNSLLIQTLANNREALIAGVSVVMPAQWSDFMDDLGLIKTEAQKKTGQ